MKDIAALPPEPKMNTYKVTVGDGEDAEEVEMHTLDILEVLRRLLGDPRFKRHMSFVPQRQYADKARKVRIYGEISSGNWMWRMQVSVCEY
jgi:hypothetical protein